MTARSIVAMNTPRIISQIRAIDNGAWDMGMADYSTSALKSALRWAEQHDSNIAVVIEDELEFRAL